MSKNKINTITAIAWTIVLSVLLFQCTPVKNNCGTKGQHKTRAKNSKKMAPRMMN